MRGFKIGGGGRGQGRGRGVCAAFQDDDDSAKRKPGIGALSLEPKPVAGGADAEAAGDGGVDPLDAFMAGIHADVTKPQGCEASFEQKAKASWEELQTEDPVASYCEAYERGDFKGREKGAGAHADNEDEEAADAEESDEENGDRRAKPIELLPPVDHSQVEYEPVQTVFYKAHAEIEALTDETVASIRSEHRIAATGSGCPRPVASFAHLGLPTELMEGIRRHGYVKPTPIQAQAIPVGFSGRDLIGIAETGSGKTVAYLMPLLVHCAAQPPLQKDQGPIGLVLCPTRELAIQVEKETYKFTKSLGLRSTTLAGGLSKYQQFRTLKGGSEIAIATPGRMIDMLKMKGCNLQRCTFAVLDEADRMMHMGFEPQMRCIMQNMRPTRQTLFFSATFPPKIERICRDLLQNPVRVTIGKLGQAAANIAQFVEVLASDEDKWPWLSSKVENMLGKGQLLVFTKSKQGAEDLANKFKDLLDRDAAVLHGDLDQDSRVRILDSYRKRSIDVLIATDLAARGLDITSIHCVVSYDVARDIETHTHRVGRTGRAGAIGEAYTLLTGTDRKMAALLVDHLELVGSTVSSELMALAMRHKPFAATRFVGKTVAARGSWRGPEISAAPDTSSRGRSRSRSPRRSPESPSPPPTP